MQHFQDDLARLVQAALAEDLGDGDHSALAVIPADVRGRAVLRIKQRGMLAGMAVAEAIFNSQEPGVRFTAYKQDGDEMQPGEEAFVVDATVHCILRCERLVLNCMQRMSGIASLTHEYVQQLAGFRTRVLDTRKTTPNFRLLEKEAVRIGGAVNHRMGLYDMIMLKDNHIDYCGGIEKAITRAWTYVQQYRPDLKIEVETRSIDDVRKVLHTGNVHRIMLDNFSPAEVAEAVSLIGGKYETEASGGIDLGNIREYAAAGVDFVSVGALIHQAKSVDLSLKAELA